MPTFMQFCGPSAHGHSLTVAALPGVTPTPGLSRLAGVSLEPVASMSRTHESAQKPQPVAGGIARPTIAGTATVAAGMGQPDVFCGEMCPVRADTKGRSGRGSDQCCGIITSAGRDATSPSV